MKAHPLRDHADHLPFCEAETARRASLFFSIMENGTGEVCQEWRESLDLYESRLAISEQLADRLEALRPGAGYSQGEATVMVGLHSLKTRKIPAFKQNTCCPHHAWKKRQSMLRALSYYCQRAESRGHRCRMFTVTSGGRCGVEEVVKRWKWIRQKIRRLNSEPWFGRYFECVFRSDELGGIHKKRTEHDEDGRRRYVYDEDVFGHRIRQLTPEGAQSWHPHSHVIVIQHRRIPRKDIADFNRRLNGWFLGRMRDEAIFDIREACKYCVKYTDVLELPDNDLLDWVDLMHRQRLVETLGGLRSLRRRLKDEQETVSKPTKSNGWQWSIQPKHYFRPPGSEDDEGRKTAKAALQLGEGEGDGENLVLSINAPCPAFGPVAEPTICVYRLTDLRRVLANPIVAKIREITHEAYAAGVTLFVAQGMAAPLGPQAPTGSPHKVRKCPGRLRWAGPEFAFSEGVPVPVPVPAGPPEASGSDLVPSL